MATDSFRAEKREDAGYVERAVMALRRSFFLSITALGVFLFALGYTFELLAVFGYPVEDGVVAGMLAIWGITAFVLGSVGYGTLWYLRRSE